MAVEVKSQQIVTITFDEPHARWLMEQMQNGHQNDSQQDINYRSEVFHSLSRIFPSTTVQPLSGQLKR
jgi:hypothetical protein